jgi:hypothetical protein
MLSNEVAIQKHNIFDENGNIIEVDHAPLHEIHPLDPITRRQMTYRLDMQLNALHDDIKAGLFGEAAKTGEFMAYLASVKEQFPKP